MKMNFKKILIVAGGVVLLAAVAGGGLYLGMLKGNKSTEGEAKAPSAAEEIVSDASGEEGGAHGAEATAPKEGEGTEKGEGAGKSEDAAKTAVSIKDLLYNFDRHFTVNLQDPSGQVYIQAAIQLETTSPEACKDLSAYDAPLRDATIMLLSSKRPEDINTPSGQERLKYELQTRYEGILPEKMIQKIFITDWMILKQ